MMEYRKLPHGGENERFSALGLGMGGIQGSSDEEIAAVVRTAIANGINFFDLCAGAGNVYAPFGRAIAGQRDKVFFQLHFGAVYGAQGEYAWSRDLTQIQETFAWELETLGTDYADFGFLHCIDEDADFDSMVSSGLLDYVQAMVNAGKVRRIGFSSHTPSVANRVLDTGLIDLMMFSINPAYDLEQGDELGIGSVSERASLFRRCQAEGVGYFCHEAVPRRKAPGGKYLSVSCCHDPISVFAICLGPAGGADCAAGCSKPGGFARIAGLCAGTGRRAGLFGDWPVYTGSSPRGSCVYCNHCQPCPAGIDIGLVNKYYDLALAGDILAGEHYRKLSVQASACLNCGHCDSRCPFHTKQSARMQEIAAYLGQ